eukprot:766123-Hanusia_phi.AAC.1
MGEAGKREVVVVVVVVEEEEEETDRGLRGVKAGGQVPETCRMGGTRVEEEAELRNVARYTGAPRHGRGEERGRGGGWYNDFPRWGSDMGGGVGGGLMGVFGEVVDGVRREAVGRGVKGWGGGEEEGSRSGRRGGGK